MRNRGGKSIRQYCDVTVNFHQIVFGVESIRDTTPPLHDNSVRLPDALGGRAFDRRRPVVRRRPRHDVIRRSLDVSVGCVIIAAAATAQSAADAAEDVSVEEAEDGGHEGADVRDCQQRHRYADDSVRYHHYTTVRRLRCYIAIPWTHTRRDQNYLPSNSYFHINNRKKYKLKLDGVPMCHSKRQRMAIALLN